MKKIIPRLILFIVCLLFALPLLACAGGLSYQAVYERYVAGGASPAQAHDLAQAFCLNNPCQWGGQ